MRKFIFKILVFFIPIFVIAISIFIINATDKFKSEYLSEDCSGRYKQLVHRLKNKTPIDVLFLGSSKTMNGICDSVLQQLTKQYCYNAGYCRYGRNLDFLLATKFINQFDIKKIVLEVREEESNETHPVFAQLASSQELFQSAKAGNTEIFSDALNHFLFNLSFIKCKIRFEKQIFENNSYYDFGYMNQATSTYDSSGFSAFDVHKNINTESLTYFSANFYLKQFSQLCKINNIQLYFLYLPNYNTVASKPLFINTYSQYGKLIISHDSMYTNLKNFVDKSHFNRHGSALFTQSIYQFLK